ncbi:PI-PLC X domain-containing protein 3 [Culicoides brevitarsis]|uniref:PI-PLC X domain-containing protein 3 n=1 Tax=Culicoides brevitarsis TaxID=469753 RepID=UPI00307BCA18
MSSEKLKVTQRLSDDLENWMQNLNAEVKRCIPLINLAIPGSHDSMSYGINRKSKPAPDAEKSMVYVYKFFLPCVVRRWARTQKLCTTEQLKSGIRFLDLRVSKKGSEYYFVHGLYCEEVETPLEEMRNFLDDHPDEFIILDCQHFYDFTPEDHLRFMQILEKTFGTRIYERKGTLLELTLDHAVTQRKQVLIVYREMRHVSGKFWYSADWPTPWPNTVNFEKLVNFLDDTLEQRAPTTGFTSQIVLTPDAKYIVPRFLFSLKSRLAKPLLKKIKHWLQEQQPGPFIEGEKPTCNVFLADFVDIKNSDFCKIVVDLNEKIDLNSEIDIIDCWQITDHFEAPPPEMDMTFE